MGFIVSPFLSPFAFGFLVARTSWRWAYEIGSMYGAIVVVLIVLFMEETYVTWFHLVKKTAHDVLSMYDRTVKPIPPKRAHIFYPAEEILTTSSYSIDGVAIPYRVPHRYNGSQDGQVSHLLDGGNNQPHKRVLAASFIRHYGV
jgi:MFS family permease